MSEKIVVTIHLDAVKQMLDDSGFRVDTASGVYLLLSDNVASMFSPGTVTDNTNNVEYPSIIEALRADEKGAANITNSARDDELVVVVALVDDDTPVEAEATIGTGTYDDPVRPASIKSVDDVDWNVGG